MTLLQVVKGRVNLESVIHTDGWRTYDGSVQMGYKKHYRVHLGANEFAGKDGHHINGIESFWAFTKLRLSQFKGA